MNKQLYLFICLLLCLLTNAPSARCSVNQQDTRYYFQRLNSKDGLSQNTVHAILQDSQGFMWFGTKDGLNRFDGLTFRVFRKEGGTLGTNFITTLYEDTDGNIWVGTDIGVYVYSKETESFSKFTINSNRNTVITQPVTSILGDKAGNIWISVDSQGLFSFNKKTRKLQNYQFNGPGQMVTGNVTHFLFDSKGRCWISFYSDNLYYSDDQFKSLHPFSSDTGEKPFRDDIINKLVEGPDNTLFVGSSKGGLKEIDIQSNKVRDLLPMKDGKLPYVRSIAYYTDDELWIGTESGIYIYNLLSGKRNHLVHDEADSYSLSDNAIYSLYKDKEGGMWIGSYFGGLNYYPKGYSYFEKYYPKKEDNFRLGKRVREFCQGKDGTIWIGTEDKGLFLFDPQNGKIQPFVDKLLYNNVHGLCMDGNFLWVGTFSKGLNRIDLRTGRVKNYQKGMREDDLSSNDIFSVCRSRSGTLWIGTTYGLHTYDRESDRFKRVEKLTGIFIYDMLEDDAGNLWIATYANGIYCFNPANNIWKHFVHEENNPYSLSTDRVLSVFQDTANRLWFTTQGGGFCMYDKVHDRFEHYNSESSALPSNVVFNMVEDNSGKLWITTNDGLFCFDPVTKAGKVYTVSSGLLSNQFNYQSAFKDRSGKIYMGTIEGFIGFDPASFTENRYVPPVVITDFLLFNRKVPVATKDSPLPKSISLLDAITLKSSQHSFSFRIAALSYQSPRMNKLMYKLEGFDKEWFYVRESPVINYSNLPYGSYTFLVKGSNSDGLWNATPTTLEIHILPPYYLTFWAFACYILVVLATLYGVYRYLKNRSVQKHRLQMEKFEREKERELYNAKVDFFTQVAHEIRTPLTLIKSPLENILKENEFQPGVEEDLQIMSRNANRLLDLTNQLLDFRKTENNAFRLAFVECEIVALLKDIHARFIPLAKQRCIDFRMDIPLDSYVVSCDREALIKIVSNLFSNALNHAGGFIHVKLVTEEPAGWFSVVVANDGEIVPSEMREAIFKPFVQYNDKGKKQTSGTGIGLALARSLAELHEGTLVMDETLELNVFRLTLPVHHKETIRLHSEVPLAMEDVHATSEFIAPLYDILPIDQKTNDIEPELSNVQTKSNERKEVVLVVEDNQEMRGFLCRHLSPHYTVLAAADGQEAIEMLDTNYVNLIVSDVMMPKIDGLELCSRIKSDLSYSHIPIILLTAKTNVQAKIDGIRSGADAYIEKPFSIEFLLVSISGMLTNREKLHQAFVSSPFIGTSTMAITKADESFLKILNEEVERNMSDPEFNLDDLAASMHMSRSSLNRKIKGILDLTPNDYIRLERLKKAASLLQEGECKINEVCYRVGFNTPSYFAKCFQKQFGVLPKDFVNP